MFSTRINSGNVYASEFCIDMTPKFPSAAKVPGVAFVHGAGSDATYCLAPYGTQSTLTQRVGSVYPAIAGDNGGDTWGSSTGVARLDGYLTRLKARTDADPAKYALICASMGGLVALNYAAQAAVKPRAIVGVIPVMNTNDIVTNNRGGYAAAVNTAYGTYNEAAMGGTYNPWTMRAAAKLQGIPMLFFYGQADTICIPQYTQDFAAADPNNRTLISMTSGHDENSYLTANAQADTIMAFLKANM